MKQRAAKNTNDAGAPLEDELSEAELTQVSGGGLLSSPLGGKLRPPTTQWSGTPYQPEEDVEAY
jgi:hypothetical protein